jgi:hypothetical protein
MLGNSWVAERLAASEGLDSMKLCVYKTAIKICDYKLSGPWIIG